MILPRAFLGLNKLYRGSTTDLALDCWILGLDHNSCFNPMPGLTDFRSMPFALLYSSATLSRELYLTLLPTPKEEPRTNTIATIMSIV